MDLVWLEKQGSNFTENGFSYMHERLDHEAIPQQYQIYIILLYTSTAIFALVSNLITLIVLKKGRRTSRNLSKYLINLSCSDLLMATFSIPFTYTNFMYDKWYFEPRFCPVVLASQFYSLFVSLYTMVAIGVDRYIAIKMPIRSKTIVNLTNFIIGSVWVVGFVLAAIDYQLADAIPVRIGNDSFYVCRLTLSEEGIRNVTLAMFAITFVVPISVLSYVYYAMAMVIFRRDLSNSASLMLKRQRRKIIKILMVVVVASFVCWTPFQIYNALNVLFPEIRSFSSEGELTRYMLTIFAVHWLAMAHSFVNPIIYSFMSQSFRKEFMNLFCKRLNFAQIRSSFRGKSTSIQIVENTS